MVGSVLEFCRRKWRDLNSFVDHFIWARVPFFWTGGGNFFEKFQMLCAKRLDPSRHHHFPPRVVKEHISVSRSSNFGTSSAIRLAVCLLILLALAPQSIGSPSYTIQELGLTGTPYDYSSSAGIVQDTTAQFTNNVGEATGWSDRYDSAGNSLGQDVWFFDGTQSREIGPTGPGYSYAVSGGTY